MKYICITVLIITISSCNLFPDHSAQVEWEEYYQVPTTSKEIKLQHELEEKGFSDIEFGIPISGRGNMVNRTYFLEMYTNANIDSTDIDSLTLIRYNLANKMYKEVIEDSMLIDLNRIEIKICVRANTQGSKVDECFTDDYYIDSLAKWNGFKVVKIAKNKFERVET